MTAFGSFENDGSEFRECARELVKAVTGKESDDFLAMPIASDVERLAKAAKPEEQHMALHNIREYLTGLLNPDSRIAWKKPDMDEASRILKKYDLLKPIL